jgi:glucose-6-phosphate dehydrogenase assembly protein OpcA
MTAAAVDIAQVERQLSALWKEGGDAVSRACLFNLVVWCESETDAGRATATVGELTGRHPCRAIVLLAASGDAPLTASISAHCRRAGGGKQVCSEQITVRAGGSSVAQLAPTVFSLLEGDLPTVLWWRGNFLEQPAQFERLRDVAGRIVFDTSAWPGAERQLKRLHQMIATTPGRMFDDLSWTRLTLWRKLTADCFDDAQVRPMLKRIQCVLVRHGGGAGARVRALLYAGWLATRLGWTTDRARVCVRVEECAGEDVSEIGIESVELLSGEGSALIRKDFGGHTAQAVVTMPQLCSRPRRQAFAPLTETELMAQEFDHVAPHTGYERALALAGAVETFGQML